MPVGFFLPLLLQQLTLTIHTMASENPTDAIHPNADRPDPPNAAEPAAEPAVETKLAPGQEVALFKHFNGYLFTERNGELKS